MTLLILVLVTLALFALFWSGTLIAQGYLYNQPVEKLPLRAAAAGLLVGTFITFWVGIDKRNPGKYDTFFEFAGETSKEFHEFDAVRWQVDPTVHGKIDFKKGDGGAPAEKTSTFKRPPANKTAQFREVGSNEPFELSNSRIVTTALFIKTAEGEKPTRFSAQLKRDDRAGVVYQGDRRFVEDGGSRYVRADQIGLLFVPSSGTVFVALLLNFLLFVVWFVAFWPILRFNWGHALGFAAVFGLVSMLIVMPLLFKPNRTPKAPEGQATIQTHLPHSGV